MAVKAVDDARRWLDAHKRHAPEQPVEFIVERGALRHRFMANVRVDPPHPVMIFYGPRKVGTTSFMLHLQHEYVRDRHLCPAVFLDVSSLGMRPEPEPVLSAICSSLGIRCCSRATHGCSTNLLPWKRASAHTERS